MANRNFNWRPNWLTATLGAAIGLVIASTLVLAPSEVQAVHDEPTPFQLDGHVPAQLQQMERTAIVAALEACNQNQTQAARRLGISRRSLIYKMERFGLKSPPRSR